MTNSEIYVLAMPLIAVAAVGLTAVLLVYQINQKRSRPVNPPFGVRGRMREDEAGIFHFQPDSGSEGTTAFKKVVEKETAGH